MNRYIRKSRLCCYAICPEADISFAASFARLVSLGARHQVEHKIRSQLVPFHGEDIEYPPYYPEPLRDWATSLSFTDSDISHGQIFAVHILNGILNDAPLAVMLGAIAWFDAWFDVSFPESNDEHDKIWHDRFNFMLMDLLNMIFAEYPLPELSAQGLSFCIELSFDCPETFSSIEPKRTLKTFAAIVMLLRSRDIPLHCCRGCTFLCTYFSQTENYLQV